MNDLKRSASSSFHKSMTAGQARVVLFGAFVAAIFAGVGLLHTRSHVAVVDVGYRLSQVQVEHTALLRENEHLKMERATLRSAPRLEAVARTKLNMAPPTATQLIAIGGSRPLTAPEPRVAQAARPLRSRNP